MITTANGRMEAHNERPAAVWNGGGMHYDEISRGISDSLDHCVRRLNPLPGERVLDLSTGTGWTSRIVARCGASVTGADIAGDLLEIAEAKAAAEHLPIEYQLADAECLPFDDGAFDAVISTYGVMFATRPEAAAGEMARVCRKGGRIALTTWLSDGNIFRMFQLMQRHAPTPATPAPPSPFEWGRKERIHELLGSAFELRFEMGVSYYREPSSAAAWNTFSKGYGPLRSLAGNLDPERRQMLRDDFIAFHADFPTELGICVPREYWVTIGVRV